MHSKKLTREELYKLVWSKPATKLAPELGISDCAITKLCRRHQVPKPWPGYWNALSPVIPKLPAARPGQRERIVIESLRDDKSQFRPEILRRIEREKTAGSRIVVRARLRSLHPLVREAKSAFENAISNKYGRLCVHQGNHTTPSLLDLRVSKGRLPRALRIMDALIKALEARGFQIQVGSRTAVTLEGQKVGFCLWEKVDRSERESEKAWSGIEETFTPSGKLIFEIDSVWVHRRRWKDGKSTLEDQLNEIMIGLISAGEVMRLRQIGAEEEEHRREEAKRWQQEEQRRREVAEGRGKEFETQSELWSKRLWAQIYLRECEKVLSEAGPLLPESPEARWLFWARAHADSMEDPFKSRRLQRAIEELGETL